MGLMSRKFLADGPAAACLVRPAGAGHHGTSRRQASHPFAAWLLATGLVVVLPLAADGLRFDPVRIEIKVTPEQEQVEAVFSFVNEGTKPARIESVVSDCACLKAEAPQGELAPGAKGTVRGFFKVGNFRGTVEKEMVALVRQDGRTTRCPLSVAIVVPELIRVEPPTLTWTIGEEPVEKSFRIHMVWSEEIRLLKAECVRKEFQFRLETLVPGREYAVYVKPLKTDLPCIGLCQFLTDCKFEKFRNPYGFVHIRRPLASPGGG